MSGVFLGLVVLGAVVLAAYTVLDQAEQSADRLEPDRRGE